jgi:hypothetical protein
MPKGLTSELFAFLNASNTTITLSPGSPDDKVPSTNVTVTWQDNTPVQEGTNTLSFTVKKSALGDFFKSIAALSDKGTALPAPLQLGQITFAQGAGMRQHNAVVSSPDLNSGELPVSFIDRTRGATFRGTPTLPFSKANYVYGLEYMEEWRATWQRAIALAWSDPGTYPATPTITGNTFAGIIDITDIDDTRNYIGTITGTITGGTFAINDSSHACSGSITGTVAITSTGAITGTAVATISTVTSAQVPEFPVPFNFIGIIANGTVTPPTGTGILNFNNNVTIDINQGYTSPKSQLINYPFLFLKTYCNYALPPTVDLVVVDATTMTSPWGFQQDPSTPNGPGWRWTLSPSVLIMFLPPAPTDGTSDAVALAAYEAVGKSYPFTMSS